MALLAIVVVLALVYDFVNGFHDSANAIATVVATRVLSPVKAVVLGGTLNFIGAMMGTEVAATIGKGLVDPSAVAMTTLLFTLAGAILWNLFTWYRGLPTSSSHALIGALLGAACFGRDHGSEAIHGDTVLAKVVAPMVFSPLIGLVLGAAVMTALTWAVHRFALFRINRLFGRLQLCSAGFMALTHGLNDAQKSMGIIALALLLANPGGAFAVPLWVKLACAAAMGLGTLCGGWRIVRTLGGRLIRLQPAQGFAAETTASVIIGGASHFGIPVSTTHVITSSIMGVGAAQRLSAVRWALAARIAWAWILTIPATFAISGGLTALWRACGP